MATSMMELVLTLRDRFSPAIRRAGWAFEEFVASWRAAKSAEHAAWFCSLPRWRRALWVIAHGAYLV